MPFRERVKLWKREKSLFQSNVEASTFFISACCEIFFFHRETCAAKDDFMWCDFFFICAVDVIVYASWDIPSFGILWIVCFWLRCYACTFALYIKVEFLYTSLWCHLYNNITSLVINGRKSFFFIYIYVSALYVYKPYISCIFLYITHNI